MWTNYIVTLVSANDDGSEYEPRDCQLAEGV